MSLAGTYRHALEETDVEAQLVPLHGGALNFDKGEGDAGLPVLRGLRIHNKKRGVVWSVEER